MKNILLIGAGNLGSRHLQSLAQLKGDVALHVVDPSKENLEKAQSLYLVAESEGRKYVSYAKAPDRLPPIDLAIIATNSDVRADVTRNLLSGTRVSAILFEKILFQEIEDYKGIPDLLQSRDIKAWVNCPRRKLPIYKEIRKKADSPSRLYLDIAGGDLGLGSNSIHFVDLMSFLSGELKLDFDLTGLDPVKRASKRPGFWEFSGSLLARAGARAEMRIASIYESQLPLTVNVYSESFHYIVDEGRGKVRFALKEDNWVWQQEEFSFPYQSQMTHLDVQNILDGRDPGLISLGDSSILHQQFLRAIIAYLQTSADWKGDSCPIT